MGMLVHLLGGFTWFIGPLIIWLMKKDSSPYIDKEGKESLNWQITLTIGAFAIGIVLMILGFIPFLGCVIWLVRLLFFLVVFVGNLILCIMAGLKAKEDGGYKYPYTFKLLS